MKKLNFFVTLLIGILFFSSMSIVKAEVTTEEYNLLKNVYSDNMISVMSDEQIKKALSYDLANSVKDTVYYKGVTNGNNQSYTWKEINEDEYNESELNPLETSVSTNYKRVNLTVSSSPDGKQYLFNLFAVWKVTPAVKSYDVIAFRFVNVAIINGSQSGTQYYRERGKTEGGYVFYSYNGTNIKKQGNNFGISMNIVNKDVEELEFNINCEGLISASYPQVYGSYQHAADDVTLAQSQDYNISPNGLGGVINFSAAVTNKYDGMRGVSADLF